MPRLLKKPWHDAFLECAAPHTEAPDRFLTWSALSVIGGVLKDHVFLDWGTYTLRTNQYIILVSPPGIGKGTAINFAWDMVKEGGAHPLVNLLSDRITAPRIIEKVAEGWNPPPAFVGQQIVLGNKDHTCCINSTELRVLLSASDWMLEFLCEGWDKKTYESETKNSGSSAITGMCTSLIGATVPDFLRSMDRNAEMTVSGGFTSRCLFIYEDTPSKVLIWPEPLKKNHKSKGLYDHLVADLISISQLQGEYSVATDAKLVYEAFVRKIRALDVSDSEALANFKARIHTHVLKLAMVVSAASSDTLIITRMAMENAISLVEQVYKTLDLIFRGAGNQDIAPYVARIQTFIEKEGAVSRKQLLRQMYRHMSPEVMDKILYILKTIEFIEVVSMGNQEWYRHKAQKP